ncbi:uncharacterized protein LOC135381243 [Ornithodoros turicata]|uniref:uncharacterized protein LOC135381243 n=1 Tax=Ornithodoros turicata TaxID=34597 RepID=UPI003138A421
MKEIESYCEDSGACLNKDKSIGIWAGQWGSTPITFEDIKWQCEPSVYLGVPLQESRNPNKMWTKLCKKVRTRANMCKVEELSIFQRAAVCNVFLVAKLVYWLQVMQCSRAKLQQFHRVFASFIWKSNFESMRRSNLFKPVCDGGAGLQHLFVKQLIMRLFFFRRCRHPVLRSMLQSVGYVHLPEIVVETVKRTFSVSGFYKEVVESIRFLLTRFSPEYLFSVSRSKLRVDLVDCLFPVPVYRQIPDEWSGLDVLCRVRKMPIKPIMKTFFFKIHTNTLPVKAWLAQKGIFVPWSVNCRYCKEPETIEHVFLYCTEAQFMWDDLSTAIRKRIRLNPHTIRYLPLIEKSGPRRTQRKLPMNHKQVFIVCQRPAALDPVTRWIMNKTLRQTAGF